MKKIISILCMTGMLVTMPAQAHYLWIEPVNGEAHLCFGEYENLLREKTGGRLDTIALPEVLDAHHVSVANIRKADHLVLDAQAGRPLIAQEITMKVKDLRKHNIGIVKPMYYARFAASESEDASRLQLDIQPVGKNRVRVSLHGRPLVKAKLNIFAPNQWQREYASDEQGEVAVDTPWPGLYVVEVVHVEPVKGEYQGDAYEGVRHVSTLSFVR